MSKYNDLAKPIKPNAPSYNGDGFGYLFYHGALLCNDGKRDWIAFHYQKYPEGKLPKQTMEIVRVK